MARGVVYVMSCTQGLYKIGKTETGQFENRMANLESNGYRNFNGLKRQFAVEVEDYDEKEKLIHRLFDKSQVKLHGSGIEMFTVDLKLIIDLLKAFDGKQIYPKLEESVTSDKKPSKITLPPDGEYYLSQNKKGFGPIKGTMKVADHQCIVLKGSFFAPWAESGEEFSARTTAKVKDNRLVEDFVCGSVSLAASACIGRRCNGWELWKDKDGEPIDKFRSRHGKN